MGDVANVDEPKQIGILKNQIEDVTNNVLLLLKGGTLKPHKLNTIRGGVFSMGPKLGLWAIGLTFSGSKPSALKNMFMTELPVANK